MAIAGEMLRRRMDEVALFDEIARDMFTAVQSDVLDGLGYRDQAMTADVRPAREGAFVAGRAHTLLASDI